MLNLAFAALLLAQSDAPALQVEMTLSPDVLAEPFTGRVFVMARKMAGSDRPGNIGWFNPQPVFARDVAAWKPGTPLVFRPEHGIGKTWEELAKEAWHLQAILDRDLGGQNCITAAGNLYSKPVAYDPEKPAPVKLMIDQAIAERSVTDTEQVRHVAIDSRLLSEFHGKPMRLRARVILPKSFAESTAKYPVVYDIPGFSGTHLSRHIFENQDDVGGCEMLRVVLDPSCRTGHHVFADSDNNGPCGRALIEELIPHIEGQYRGLATPQSRFLTGHSSGGWSSLWLQTTYPQYFGGTWSTAPDPVDFRDFQRVNIYEPNQNIFFDAKGELRPLARRDGRYVLHYKPFSDMEVVMGRGGQLQSFEAVFGPRGADGKPVPLWDRRTGVIDPKVAEAWKRYDIRLRIEQNWKTLAPQLAGKVNVIMGAEDTFLLDGATRLLKESLARLGSDAVVEIVEGKDHGTVRDAALRKRIADEMAAAAKKLKAQ